MISNYSGYLFTGTRCFQETTISQIELWHTDGIVNIAVEFAPGGYDEARADADVRAIAGTVRLILDDKTVTLDEEESRVVRRWAELSAQTAAIETEDILITQRCLRQESLNRARKLNQASARRMNRVASRKHTKEPATVVDLQIWKTRNRPEVMVNEACTLPAA